MQTDKKPLIVRSSWGSAPCVFPLNESQELFGPKVLVNTYFLILISLLLISKGSPEECTFLDHVK